MHDFQNCQNLNWLKLIFNIIRIKNNNSSNSYYYLSIYQRLNNVPTQVIEVKWQEYVAEIIYFDNSSDSEMDELYLHYHDLLKIKEKQNGWERFIMKKKTLTLIVSLI